MYDKFWIGEPPKKCDLCEQPVTTIFVDGATDAGPWAAMCEGCHVKRGRGFGTGQGQRYEKQADGRFKKVQG